VQPAKNPIQNIPTRETYRVRSGMSRIKNSARPPTNTRAKLSSTLNLRKTRQPSLRSSKNAHQHELTHIPNPPPNSSLFSQSQPTLQTTTLDQPHPNQANGRISSTQLAKPCRAMIARLQTHETRERAPHLTYLHSDVVLRGAILAPSHGMRHSSS
jgi:hypothetical protein